MSLVAVRSSTNKDFGTVVMNEGDEIIAFREKSETQGDQYISAGIYCFGREVLDIMPAGKFSIEYDFFPKMIGQDFYGYKLEAPFIDIGTPERFEWAKKHLSEMIT
jgi:NDP-sugar pyrophosphorylase family protein